jgi:hypothetical protein
MLLSILLFIASNLDSVDYARSEIVRFYESLNKPVVVEKNSAFYDRQIGADGRHYWVAKAVIKNPEDGAEYVVAFVYDRGSGKADGFMAAMLQNNFEKFEATGDRRYLHSFDVLNPNH